MRCSAFFIKGETKVLRLQIIIRDVSLRKGFKPLIDGLDFTLLPGEVVAVTGDNGVGKTTLLRAVAGFITPQSGQMAFADETGEIEAEAARAQHIHYLGHHDALSPSRTVAEELAFQAAYLGGEVGGAVEPLRLKPLLTLETRLLSAGQRRRVSLARLLMSQRPLWLLDEPMAPLDADNRALMSEIIVAHAAKGGSVLMARHDPLPFETRQLRLSPVTEAAW